MKKYFKKLFIFTTLFLPVQLVKAVDLIPCGRGDDLCEFSDFFELINRVMNFLLFRLAIPITALVIIYGGMVMVIYASNSGKRSDGKKAITTGLLGLVIALGAFVIVKFILITLTGDSSLLPAILQ